jgi:hypothetical protein
MQQGAKALTFPCPRLLRGKSKAAAPSCARLEPLIGDLQAKICQHDAAECDADA